ncbi:MAG: RNA polymerase sigma factor FliA [Gammaproteobacteria bacterium]
MSQVAAYKKTAEREEVPASNKLIEDHGLLVKRIAYHLMTRLPASVQVDDLIQSGMIGLLEASRNYDATQGASFETYAGIRIRGSMLDEIRKGDWAPRSLHRKVRELTKAINEVEAKTGEDAKDADVAAHMEITLDEYYQILQHASGHRMFSFEDLVSGEEGFSESLVDSIEAPSEQVEKQKFKEALTKAISTLPDRERLVMSLYYEEELNLRETGEVLGVSESRVCQIHSRALVRLKARMQDWVNLI